MSDLVAVHDLPAGHFDRELGLYQARNGQLYKSIGEIEVESEGGWIEMYRPLTIDEDHDVWMGFDTDYEDAGDRYYDAQREVA